MRWDIALTIKPTMSCNMKCKHCFNGECAENGQMLDINAAKRFIELAARDYQNVKVTFHGGEPSLAGLEYYKELFRYEKDLEQRYNCHFTHYFTTNGLALNDAFLMLLRDNKTTVNFSFDGPYNDVLRERTSIVFNHILRAQQLCVPFRIFCTICSKSYQGLENIYLWFNGHKMDFKIAPIEPRGFAEKRPDLIMDPDKFVRELNRVYSKWINDTDCQVFVGTFEEFARLRSNNQFKPYWFEYEIALNPDGKIYPFGRPNDQKFCLGDPFEVSCLKECFESQEYIRLKTILKGLWEHYCFKCESYHVCHGVCMCMNYVYDERPEMLEYSCSVSRRIFKTIMNTNERAYMEIKNGVPGRWNPYFYNAINENRN